MNPRPILATQGWGTLRVFVRSDEGRYSILRDCGRKVKETVSRRTFTSGKIGHIGAQSRNKWG